MIEAAMMAGQHRPEIRVSCLSADTSPLTSVRVTQGDNIFAFWSDDPVHFEAIILAAQQAIDHINRIRGGALPPAVEADEVVY